MMTIKKKYCVDAGLRIWESKNILNVESVKRMQSRVAVLMKN